jgi:uncharacterized membrane protein
MLQNKRHDENTKTGLTALFLLLLSGAVIAAIFMSFIAAFVPLWLYASVASIVVVGVAILLSIKREGFNYVLALQIIGVGLFTVAISYGMGQIVRAIFGWYTSSPEEK